MKASIIVPNYHNDSELPKALSSLKTAIAALPEKTDAEIIVVQDIEGNGLSWARNRGLEQASGEYVFFCDADDQVEKFFLAKPLAAIESSHADFCIFDYAYAPLKRDYNLSGNESIRAALLPAFMGFSWADFRRAIAAVIRGLFVKTNQTAIDRFTGALSIYREPGSVWRCVFRKSFLDLNNIRFNEKLRIYEDAPFMCECALNAGKTVSLKEKLYNYSPGESGIVRTVTNSKDYWCYKREIAIVRENLNRRYGGRLRKYYGASKFLSFIESVLHFCRKFDIIHTFKPQTGL